MNAVLMRVLVEDIGLLMRCGRGAVLAWSWCAAGWLLVGAVPGHSTIYICWGSVDFFLRECQFFPRLSHFFRQKK